MKFPSVLNVGDGQYKCLCAFYHIQRLFALLFYHIFRVLTFATNSFHKSHPTASSSWLLKGSRCPWLVELHLLSIMMTNNPRPIELNVTSRAKINIHCFKCSSTSYLQNQTALLFSSLGCSTVTHLENFTQTLNKPTLLHQSPNALDWSVEVIKSYPLIFYLFQMRQILISYSYSVVNSFIGLGTSWSSLYHTLELPIESTLSSTGCKIVCWKTCLFHLFYPTKRKRKLHWWF